ncbi:uncharacterized protein K02A2.6-like, partial [Argonauta hians]
MGCKHSRTTAYHPQANGLVERFHRQLKYSLSSYPNTNLWSEYLPIVLLGIRSTLKQDLGHTPAEMLYGRNLVLPGQMIAPVNNVGAMDVTLYISRLREYMQALSPAQTRKSTQPSYVPKDIQSWTHVFVRNDRVGKNLDPSYQGPFKVISR